MQNLIKDHGVVADDWTRLPRTGWDGTRPLPEGKLIVPLVLWVERGAALLETNPMLGVWLDSDEDPAPLRNALHQVAVVAINFPIFSDGRGYSIARIVRDQFGYKGELRAVGDVLRDQLFLMRRCGFDSFELRADRDPVDALPSLDTFRNVYQRATVDPSPPLLRRGSTRED